MKPPHSDRNDSGNIDGLLPQGAAADSHALLNI